MITLPSYTIERELGRGGMATVYEAMHNGLKTRHAVKVLEVSSSKESSTLTAKFLAEARILANLKHTNIVRVTDLGTLSDGRPYFIMDIAAKGSLAERLAEFEPPSPESVRAWYVQLRDALALCHRHGIVHGDIKPENVLLGADGELILSDFGIARLTDHTFRANLDLSTATLPGNFGTPYTLAPECRHGEKSEPTADVYSFGVLIFKCLTGLWFEGSPRLLGEIDIAFPEWSPLLRRMLAYERSARFASAEDLPTSAPEPCTRPKATPQHNRNEERPLCSRFISACAIIILILLINYTWKFLYMYSIRASHPDWLMHVFP